MIHATQTSRHIAPDPITLFVDRVDVGLDGADIRLRTEGLTIRPPICMQSRRRGGRQHDGEDQY
jgi:hypothetical protein